MGLFDAYRRYRERRALEREKKKAVKAAVRAEKAGAPRGHQAPPGPPQPRAPHRPASPQAAPPWDGGRPPAGGQGPWVGPAGPPAPPDATTPADAGGAPPAPEPPGPAEQQVPAETPAADGLAPDAAAVEASAADAPAVDAPAVDAPAADQATAEPAPPVPAEPQLASLDPQVKAERRRRARGSRPRRAAEPAPLPPDQARALLQALATEHLRPEAAVALMALARPALRLHPDAAREPTDPGSRLGGLPLLPPNAAWPTYRGRPLHFVAQIRLDEAARQDVELALPRYGLLAFFHLPVEDVWGYDPSDRDAWAVLRFDAASAVPRAAPEDVEVYEPRQLRTLGTWSVPDRFAAALARVRELAGDDDAVDAVLGAYSDSTGRVRHQLLGWPAEGEDPMARAAAAASAGMYAGTGRLDDAALAAAGVEPARWRLLLQLDSDDDAGMVWGDDCRLCFWLPEQALRAGRFADTWMLVRCG